MTTNMRPATAVKSARAPTFRFRSKALFEHIAGPLQAGAASLTLNKAPRVRRAWRLPAPQFLPLLLQGVAGGFLDLAHALLHATLELVGGAVGAELVVAGGLADRVLDMAARLFARAFDFVLVHLTLLAWVGFNSLDRATFRRLRGLPPGKVRRASNKKGSRRATPEWAMSCWKCAACGVGCGECIGKPAG